MPSEAWRTEATCFIMTLASKWKNCRKNFTTLRITPKRMKNGEPLPRRGKNAEILAHLTGISTFSMLPANLISLSATRLISRFRAWMRPQKRLSPNTNLFERTGDVYCLFMSLESPCSNGTAFWLLLLPINGCGQLTERRCAISFLESANTIKVIDFAGNKVFKSATVDVNIMILEKIKALKTKNLNKPSVPAQSRKIARTIWAIILSATPSSPILRWAKSWAILSPIEQSIKRKIEAVGKPL